MGFTGGGPGEESGKRGRERGDHYRDGMDRKNGSVLTSEDRNDWSLLE